MYTNFFAPYIIVDSCKVQHVFWMDGEAIVETITTCDTELAAIEAGWELAEETGEELVI